MKKTLIVYFTKTGNNKFIAEKMSELLSADLDVIVPKLNNFFLLIICSWLKISVGVKPLSSYIENYDRLILLGPVWVGSLISPIRGFIKKYKESIKELVFVTVCGSGEEDREGKFGTEQVFSEIRKLFSKGKISCFDISTKSLEVKPKSSSGQPLISEELFAGEIKKRFEEIIQFLRE